MSLVNDFDDWLGEDATPREGVLMYVGLLVYYGFLLLPIAYFVLSSFKPSSLLRSSNLVIIPIESFTLTHWETVLSREAFQIYFMNSMVIAVGTTALVVVFGTLAGYSVSRMEYPGRSTLIVGYLFTTMLPRVLILIPFFLIMFNLGLLDTHLGIILAHTVIGLPFVTWLLKGYFDDIPTSLDEAAKMDGCSDLQILYRIILPLALPGVAVGAFFTFVVSWNDYLFVSILSTSQATRTLPFALQLFQTQNTINWGAVVTAATVTMIPVVVLFAFVQNYLVEGLTGTGTKGN